MRFDNFSEIADEIKKVMNLDMSLDDVIIIIIKIL